MAILSYKPVPLQKNKITVAIWPIKNNAINQLYQCKKLLQTGRNEEAFELYKELSKTIKPFLASQDELRTLYNELGGDIHQRNGKYKEANSFYQKILKDISL